MPALVVFDCFDTLVTSRPLPEPGDLARDLAAFLSLEPRTAGAVVESVYGAVLTAVRNPAALQPATMELLDTALAARGERRAKADLERALWHAWGCADPGAYRLCEPMADAVARVTAAGHTARLLSNCFLPGSLMAELLHRLRAPAVDRALFTADGGPKKPDRRAYELIGAGEFDRRVMVGDSPQLDIVPAAALGWDTVLVDPRDPSPAPLLALLEL